MSKFINSIFSKPEAARLKRKFGVVGTEEYGILLILISGYVRSSMDHGVLPLDIAWSLSEAGFCEVTAFEVKGFRSPFLVYRLKPKPLTGVRKFHDYTLDDPELYLRYDRTDPYMRDLDHLGDLAEEDPRFASIPVHHNWGKEVFLFTRARLIEELDGDWSRLIHRTPYRPLPSWHPHARNRLLDSQASALAG